jgi:hypothetical protein
LLCLGFDVSERSVSRYLRSLPRTPRANATWTTFLRNHRDGIAGMDFFTVPTAMFRVLPVVLVIRHGRRDGLRSMAPSDHAPGVASGRTFGTPGDLLHGVPHAITLTNREMASHRLLLLNGILRPILRREWAALVASMNGLPESRLEEFLFGASRIPLGEVRGPLAELQGGRCVFCEDALRGPTDVDHFIPWARYPDNGLDNLVAAHSRWNNRKRDFLAAAEPVERWAARNAERANDISQAGADFTWERDAARSRSVAVATYSRLDEGAKVWIEGATLVGLEKVRVERALAGWA